jgi:hypothetical protein
MIGNVFARSADIALADIIRQLKILSKQLRALSC